MTNSEGIQDVEVTFRIDGMTLEESLDFVLTTNAYFYKVLKGAFPISRSSV